MKTLVIHPFDVTTGFLEEIYIDKGWTIIDENISHKKLKESIKSHDRVVMLGHGTEYGLIGFDRLIINSELVYLLREKVCVCIWCNADLFVNKYGLKGFYTGMFISEEEEARMFEVNSSEREIQESNILFVSLMKEHIDNDDLLKLVKEGYADKTDVIKYNRERLYEII